MTKRVLKNIAAPAGALALIVSLAACDPVEAPEGEEGQQPGGMMQQDSMDQSSESNDFGQ